jgi:hypothetical protein
VEGVEGVDAGQTRERVSKAGTFMEGKMEECPG